LGLACPQAGLVLNDLAVLYFRNKRNKKATETYLKALSVYEKVFGKNHPEVGKILILLENFELKSTITSKFG
jgi:hypothetical protein